MTRFQAALVINGVLLGVLGVFALNLSVADAQSASTSPRVPSINVTGTGTATKFSATAASGANGLELQTSGARADFGAGASDYVSSNGTTVTAAGPWAMASSLTFNTTTTNANQIILPVNTRICLWADCSVYLMGNAGADLHAQSIGRILTNGLDLGNKDLTVYTCSSQYENTLIGDTLRGANTGSVTNTCRCRSNGSNTFAYQNMKTGWVGTSTTCPSDESASVSGALNFAEIAAQSCAETTLALTGAVATDKVSCQWPTALEAGLIGTCKGGTDVITFRLCNPTSGAIDPASQTFGATVIR